MSLFDENKYFKEMREAEKHIDNFHDDFDDFLSKQEEWRKMYYPEEYEKKKNNQKKVFDELLEEMAKEFNK